MRGPLAEGVSLPGPDRLGAGPLTGRASRVRMVSMDRPPGRAATPHKRVVTAPRLDELHGPVGGVIELPHRLFWQADLNASQVNR